MGINLEMLTPAPWYASFPGNSVIVDKAGGRGICAFLLTMENDINYDEHSTNAVFVALARNDLDVKQRRGWHTEKCSEVNQWLVPQLIECLCGKSKEEGDKLIAAMYQNDHDVGLLTKADEWYKANVEKTL